VIGPFYLNLVTHSIHPIKFQFVQYRTINTSYIPLITRLLTKMGILMRLIGHVFEMKLEIEGWSQKKKHGFRPHASGNVMTFHQISQNMFLQKRQL